MSGPAFKGVEVLSLEDYVKSVLGFCIPGGSLRTTDAFPVIASSDGEKRRPEMRLLFAGKPGGRLK